MFFQERVHIDERVVLEEPECAHAFYEDILQPKALSLILEPSITHMNTKAENGKIKKDNISDLLLKHREKLVPYSQTEAQLAV